MVTHETYPNPDRQNITIGGDHVTIGGKKIGFGPAFLAPDEIERRDGRIFSKATGSEVQVGRVEKMSKSKKNVVDPDDIVDQYGADAVRWFMLSDSPPERDLPWTSSGIEGSWRFVNRLWRLFGEVGETGTGGEDKPLLRKLHQTVDGVARDIEALSFNKAVAKIYELANAIEKAAPSQSRTDAIRALALLVAPMVPHLAEEAWSDMGQEGLIADAAWPPVDPALLVEDEVTIACQVMGKLRDTITVPKGLSRQELEALALAAPNVARTLDGATPKKVIVVPDRLVNLVV